MVNGSENRVTYLFPPLNDDPRLVSDTGDDKQMIILILGPAG